MDIKVQSGIAIIPSNETSVVVELERKVDKNRSVVLHGGTVYGYSHDSFYSNSWDSRLVLLDDKHIEVKRAYPSYYSAETAWQVVEVIPDAQVMTSEVVYCRDCTEHEKCMIENIFRLAKIENPFCCAGCRGE